MKDLFKSLLDRNPKFSGKEHTPKNPKNDSKKKDILPKAHVATLSK